MFRFNFLCPFPLAGLSRDAACRERINLQSWGRTLVGYILVIQMKTTNVTCTDKHDEQCFIPLTLSPRALPLLSDVPTRSFPARCPTPPLAEGNYSTAECHYLLNHLDERFISWLTLLSFGDMCVMQGGHWVGIYLNRGALNCFFSISCFLYMCIITIRIL